MSKRRSDVLAEHLLVVVEQMYSIEESRIQYREKSERRSSYASQDKIKSQWQNVLGSFSAKLVLASSCILAQQGQREPCKIALYDTHREARLEAWRRTFRCDCTY